MAKEIIEAVTKAEKEAADKLAAAKTEGEKLISDARNQADADYKAKVDKAHKAAETKISAAEAEAKELIKAAELKAAEEKAALQHEAGSRKQEAIKAVKSMIA